MALARRPPGLIGAGGARCTCGEGGTLAGEEAGTWISEEGVGGVARGNGIVACVACVTRMVGCVIKVFGDDARPTVPEDGSVCEGCKSL